MESGGCFLEGRVALVTGGSRGVGAATVARLARAGADVVLTYRRREAEARAVADDVRAAGRRAWVHAVDLSEPGAADALFDALEGEGGPGRLDLLVANAAATRFGPLLEAMPHHVERTFHISVHAFLRLVQRAMPWLEGSGHGRIIAVSGADTRTWIPGHGLLAAAKSALETLVRYLACEVGERGVTAVGVSPGWIDGESLRAMLGPFYEAGREMERRTHPMRESATPDDVARTIVWLARDEARWLSGETVAADGSGVFAFCGRYSAVGAMAVAAGAAGGAASASEDLPPAVPRLGEKG